MEILTKIQSTIPNFTSVFPDISQNERALQIFRQLSPSGTPSPEACFVEREEVNLTSVGCKLLFDTLEVVNKALANCVHGDGNTKSWTEAMNYFQNPDDDVPTGLKRSLTSFSIKSIVDSSASYNLDPEFQRDFVWTDGVSTEINHKYFTWSSSTFSYN